MSAALTRIIMNFLLYLAPKGPPPYSNMKQMFHSLTVYYSLSSHLREGLTELGSDWAFPTNSHDLIVLARVLNLCPSTPVIYF